MIIILSIISEKLRARSKLFSIPQAHALMVFWMPCGRYSVILVLMFPQMRIFRGIVWNVLSFCHMPTQTPIEMKLQKVYSKILTKGRKKQLCIVKTKYMYWRNTSRYKKDQEKATRIQFPRVNHVTVAFKRSKKTWRPKISLAWLVMHWRAAQECATLLMPATAIAHSNDGFCGPEHTVIKMSVNWKHCPRGARLPRQRR